MGASRPRGRKAKARRFMFSRATSGSGLDLAWRREVLKTSVRRCSPWRLTAGKVFNGNRNQPNYLSTLEPGKVEIGAEILLRISREFANSIEWLLTRKGAAFRIWLTVHEGASGSRPMRST